MVSSNFRSIVILELHFWNQSGNLHKLLLAYMPQQLILLTGKYLISKAVTFPDESIITKVSFHVDSVIKLNIPESI